MTAQMGDQIVYEGKEHFLYSCPLHGYADEEHPLPQFVSPHTANWRGYVAQWAIEKNELLLIGITAWVEDYKEVSWEGVFPRRKPPIKADWYSGDLRIPRGEQLQYIHMGFASTYEQDVILAIHRGKVVLSEVYQNTVNPGFWQHDRTRLSSDLVSRPVGMFSDEEWAFVLAVRAERPNPTNWLVYADWLTDQGDARGDYLRLRVPLLKQSKAEIPLSLVEREVALGECGWWLRLVDLPPLANQEE
jgi:uncharacterized protein (TIGR02996 family)